MQIKPEAWERVLAEDDWGEKFHLLLDKNNYEKHTSKVQQTGKTNTKRRGVHKPAMGSKGSEISS